MRLAPSSLSRSVLMFGLRIKLLICLGSLLLILITVTLVANSVLNSYSERVQQLYRNDFESAMACQSMKEAIENIDLKVQNRVWGDRLADELSVRPMEDEFEKQLARQNGKADLPGEQQATDELRSLWQR